MLSGAVWPAHPHPHKGECLSSWIVRCAQHNGLKAQTFCVQNFGHEHQIWNRDIDRLAPKWLLIAMAEKTGTAKSTTFKTTIKFYENRLYPKLHPASQLRWIIPLKLYHRQHNGFGQQYCPKCLAQDDEPYFRLMWRIAFYTFCPIHQTKLYDRCYACGAPVAFHRIEQGKPKKYSIERLDTCWRCDAILGEAPRLPFTIWHDGAYLQWNRLLNVVTREFINSGPLNFLKITMLHQICRLITSEHLSPNLHKYICDHSHHDYQQLEQNVPTFEQRDIEERHYVLELAWWLLGRTPAKLNAAIKNRALNISDLYRDLEDKKQPIIEMLSRPASRTFDIEIK